MLVWKLWMPRRISGRWRTWVAALGDPGELNIGGRVKVGQVAVGVVLLPVDQHAGRGQVEMESSVCCETARHGAPPRRLTGARARSARRQLCADPAERSTPQRVISVGDRHSATARSIAWRRLES